MTAVAEIDVTRRRPFVFGPVPPLLRFRRMALQSGIKPLRNLSKSLVKLSHRVLRRPLRGSFGIAVDGSVRWIRVESHNSHLETILAWPRGSYEPAVAASIDAFLPDDGSFFDIGANWGYHSLFAASRPGFRGRVHAFEPYPPTARDLVGIVAHSGLGDRIVVHREALSDRTGEAQMEVPQRVKFGQAHIVAEGGGQGVLLRRLDDLDLGGPDVIKLDVEGHEMMVLRGAGQTLARDKPVIVLENWLLPDQLEITLEPLRFLEGLGFRIFAPTCDAGPSDDVVRLRLEEISSATRADYPGIVDVCAIHAERTDLLGLERAE